jgi:chemotaxis signal transduction protein
MGNSFMEAKDKNEDKTKLNRELMEKFIVLEIENESFIISLEYVNEIVRIQEITEAPHQPEWVRGIMNLRDSVIMLIDTRKRLGLKSLTETAKKAIITGQEAHHFWLEKLEDAISKEYPFTLSLDPNLCANGKWLNGLLNDTNTKDNIKSVLSEAIAIHSKIYDLGKEALDFFAASEKEKAIELVEQIKSIHWIQMTELLDEIQKHFQKDYSKEIAVIVEFNGIHFAMLADEIKKMKTFSRDKRQKGSLADGAFVLGVYDDDEGLYQELDLNGILKNKNGEVVDFVAEAE